jgi:hypothetical protein
MPGNEPCWIESLCGETLSSEQPYHPQKNARAKNGDDDLGPDGIRGKTYLSGQPAAKKTAKDTDDQVSQESEPTALHNSSGYKTSDKADDDSGYD